MPHRGEEILDHQSRVVEVESWDSYIEEIKSGKSVERKNILGNNMNGYTLPSNITPENLKYDENHLSCDVYRGGTKTKKLAYLIE